VCFFVASMQLEVVVKRLVVNKERSAKILGSLNPGWIAGKECLLRYANMSPALNNTS